MNERLTESSCLLCPQKGICRKDELLVDQEELISKLRKDKIKILNKYEDILKKLPNHLPIFEEKIDEEIEILNPIYDYIIFKFNQIKEITYLYISRKEDLFDIIFVVKLPDFNIKYKISKLITDLMREYKKTYFDFLILNEEEIKIMESEEDEYIIFKVGN